MTTQIRKEQAKMSTGKLLGRTTASTGAVEEITPSTGLTMSSGNLTADVSVTFKTIAVSGQSDVVADSATDTLTLAAGSNITLTTNATTDTITIAASGGGGLTNWTEAYTSSTQATSDFTAIGAGSNINAALVAKGTGGTVAQVPDGTSTAGNSRGTYATDFQKIRSAAGQVASGTKASLGGGEDNTSSGLWATVGGGFGNTANSSGATIGGGYNNSVRSSTYSVVAGGESNYAGNTGETDNAITGGQANTISGYYCFIGGGYSNAISSSNEGVIVGGYDNDVSVSNGTVGGGQGNSVTGESGTITGGLQAKAYLYGGEAHSSGKVTSVGDCQIHTLESRFKTTTTSSGGAAIVYLDGSSAKLIPTGANRTWAVKCLWQATVVAKTGTTTGISVGDMVMGEDLLAFQMLSSTATLVDSTIGTKIGSTNMKSSGGMSYAANGGGAQELTPTYTMSTFGGGGSVDLIVNAKFSLVEVAW